MGLLRVIRESRGLELYSLIIILRLLKLCKFIGVGSNNSAEFHGLSFGLDLAISLGIKDIIIEGDSMLVFQSVSNKKCVSWHLQY